MIKRMMAALLAATMLLTLGGCNSKKEKEKAAADVQSKISQSFQTTAKVNYKDLEAVMTIYKKPMNCATVMFESPDSLKDMKLTFYPEKVGIEYKDMKFDFVPDSLPGKAASKLVLSALNTAMNDDGVSIEQNGSQLIINGKIDAGDFSLVIDAASGNILKLTIPNSDLEMEILNFKILE
ncbi:hypothetical protein V6615_00830 [Oscillospiraceae bacterium PP1C4]